MAYNCGCDYTNAPNIILPRATGDSLFTVGNPLDVPCTNGCGGVCHLEQYISHIDFTSNQSYWSFRLKIGGNACVNNNNQSPCAEGEVYLNRWTVDPDNNDCLTVETRCADPNANNGHDLSTLISNFAWLPVTENGPSEICYNSQYPNLCEDEGTQSICNPSAVTTTDNPNANGEVNYNFCYCPLSFCELAVLELGDSFSGGVYGGGAVAGENDTDAGWTRSGNTWTASYIMPCGMSGTMTMECDDSSSSFNFSATSSCCDSMTITPPSSSSVEKPPNFTASSPVSSCNCPPECCHNGDCGWTSGTTTQNPNANTTTENPDQNTTEDPNLTTQNPNLTTQGPESTTTELPLTTQCPCTGVIQFYWQVTSNDGNGNCQGQWVQSSSCDGSGCHPDTASLPNGTTCMDPCAICHVTVGCIC